MKLIADLHLHSKYSRACSKKMDFENLHYWARLKGLNLLGTGDITFPQWFKLAQESLEELGNGFLKLKGKKEEIYFLLTVEIALHFFRNNQLKRIHLLIILPNFKTVSQMNKRLSMFGKLEADGRPILSLDVKELMKILLEIDEQIIIIPAHIWTPWFSLFGSFSGFDSFEECFQEWKNYVLAVETGLSSNPPMNWRLSELDPLSIVSFSDAHSPQPHRIGREATAFELKEFSYENFKKALVRGDKENKILFTIEFYPEEGKYHFDGHRNCQLSLSPEEAIKHNNICPVCGKPLTIGVLHRVELLADRPADYQPVDRPPFYSLIPLPELIAEAYNSQVGSKKVMTSYLELIENLGPEIEILIETKITDIEKINPKIAEGIDKMRKGEVNLSPGYDGEYGKVLVFENQSSQPEKIIPKQKGLFS